MRICTMPGCGSTLKVRRSRILNKDVCLTCYHKHLRPKENCVLCGNIRIIAFREADGGAVCFVCAGRPVNNCGVCGFRKSIAGRRRDGILLCDSCVRKDPGHLKECIQCHRLAFPTLVTPKGVVGSCCYKYLPERHAKCGGCGHVKPIMGRRLDGSPLCGGCIKREPRYMKECSVCHQPAIIAKVTGGSRIGRCCYGSLPERKANCAACGNYRAIAGRTDDGRPLCDSHARIARAARKARKISTFMCIPT